MKTLLKYLKPYRLYWWTYFAIKVTATLTELTWPYILSHVLKNIVITQDLQQILFWGILMVFFATVTCVGNIIANRMVAKMSRDFAEEIRTDLFAKMLTLSSSQTDRFTIASLEARVTSDIHSVYNFVCFAQRMGVRAPIILLGGAVITLWMDTYLAVVMLVLAPLIFAMAYVVSKKGIPLFKNVQQSVDTMTRVVREDVQGIRVIKALSKERYERHRFDDVNGTQVKCDERAGRTMSIIHPAMGLIMNLGIVIVVALSAKRVQEGLSNPETVIAFTQYFSLISLSMLSFTNIFVMYNRTVVSARRIEEILLCGEELQLQQVAEYPDESSEYMIEFQNVRFSYNGNLDDVKNICFGIRKGQTLGIIGATGSGKSTLVKLLLRLYDIADGSIRISGRDIRTISQEELYAMFGTAMQNDFLYADTIYENIRFGRDLSEEEIVRAATIAQAHEFITSFEEGYQHVLAQKGTNISGGQKQRLLIARAIAARPQILILDDSSSALDYRTEANLRKALQNEMNGMTMITVAQRVSAVKSCDLILVMDEGKILGLGTHEQLLDTCPEYKEIRDSQMGGAFID